MSSVYVRFFNLFKLFSCSTQLSIQFILLINVKMSTIVCILTFISMINTTSERLKARNFFVCQNFSFYEQMKCHAKLSWAWKKFYNLGVWPRGYKTWVQSQTQNKVHWLAACVLFRVWWWTHVLWPRGQVSILTLWIQTPPPKWILADTEDSDEML